MRMRRILLCDCDAFFVQVARLVDPDGAGRTPLLLVGGRADQRGVVTSASYEARPYGVRSGMPTARALRLCPGATVVPVPRGECARRSRLIREVLGRFAPVVEAASIDEFYLDLTGTERLYHDEPLDATCRRIREAVLAETGISISIGAGANRLVAKLAVRRAKPAGVHVVPPGGEADFLAECALSDIPGVGPRFAERLERYGMRAVADALPHDERTLIGWLGEREGRWLHRRIRGIDDAPVAPQDRARSISREETFAHDVDDDATLERELLALSNEAAARLRAAGLVARTIGVKLRDHDFRTRQASRTLHAPVESDRIIHEVAKELLGRLRSRRRTGARLIGVTLSQLQGDEAAAAQLALFGPAAAQRAGPGVETERDRGLSRALDRVRERFGDDAVLPGRILYRRGAGGDGDAGDEA